MQAKLRMLEKEERRGEAFTFSPGPSQVVSKQMKTLIDEEIRQLAEDELKKVSRKSKEGSSILSVKGCRKEIVPFTRQ